MKSVGFTIFEPVGIRTDYPLVDLEKKQVTARIFYKDKLLMTVLVDLRLDQIQKEGNLSEVAHLTTPDGMKVVEEEREISIIKSQAEFFIENNISNPEEYEEQLIKDQLHK